MDNRTTESSGDRSIDDLIVGYLGDDLTDSEQADLIARLGRDPEHLRRFVDAVLFEDQLQTAVSTSHEQASVAAFEDGLPEPPSVSSSRVFTASWRTIAVAISGLAMGLVGATAVFGYIVPSLPKVIFSLREGFEHGLAPLSQGPPRGPGVWSGDYGEVIGRDRCVKPAEGRAMFRFSRSDFDGKPNPEQSYFSDLFKVIDLRPILAEGGEGPARVLVSAAFNTPAEVSQRLAGTVAVFAIPGELLAGGLPFDTGILADRAIAMSRRSTPRLDTDPGSWERARTELEVPSGAEFLVVHLGATVDGSMHPVLEFGDSFVDDVQLEIVRAGVSGGRGPFSSARAHEPARGGSTP